MTRERIPVHHRAAEQHIDDVAVLVVHAGALRDLQDVARPLNHALAHQKAGSEFFIVYTDDHDSTDRPAGVAGDRLLVVGTLGDMLSVSPYTGQVLGKLDVRDPVRLAPIVANRTPFFFKVGSSSRR